MGGECLQQSPWGSGAAREGEGTAARAALVARPFAHQWPPLGRPWRSHTNPSIHSHNRSARTSRTGHPSRRSSSGCRVVPPHVPCTCPDKRSNLREFFWQGPIGPPPCSNSGRRRQQASAARTGVPPAPPLRGVGGRTDGWARMHACSFVRCPWSERMLTHRSALQHEKKWSIFCTNPSHQRGLQWPSLQQHAAYHVAQ